MMKAQLVQFSVVVVGKTHNPSILNPDFLAINEIVPKEWNWEIAETVTTPPIAMVRYTNGLTVTVEPNKLQVADMDVGDDPAKSKAAAIAQKYVATLPHVHYAAVGINFQSIVEIADPGDFLKNKFLKTGPWDNSTRTLKGVGLRFVYPLTEGRVVLSLDAGEAEKIDENKSVRKSVVLVNGNFHRDCQGYPAMNPVIEFINEAEKDWMAYRMLLKDVLD